MNAIRLQDAIGEIQDSFLLEAYPAPSQRKSKKWLALLLVAAILALGLIACAPILFNSISGDDLSFRACYAGKGIVEITVENNSDKNLSFQTKLKLKRWSDGSEIPAHGKILFQNTQIAPASSGVMTVDLSSAYNLDELETPLHNDWYYLVLTNHNFLFGQDWMCRVSFSEKDSMDAPVYPVQPSPAEADPELYQQIETDLRPFFGESILVDKEKRAEMTAAYYERCAEVIRASGKNVIHPVSPAPTFLIDDLPPGITLDHNLPEEIQYQLIGLHTASIDSYAFPVGASWEDTAYIFSIIVPQKEADLTEAAGGAIQATYVMVFDAAQAAQPDSFALIHGQLVPLSELCSDLVYHDGQYMAFNVTKFFFSDLDTHIAAFRKSRTDLFFNEDVLERIHNGYTYLQEAVKGMYLYGG